MATNDSNYYYDRKTNTITHNGVRKPLKDFVKEQVSKGLNLPYVIENGKRTKINATISKGNDRKLDIYDISSTDDNKPNSKTTKSNTNNKKYEYPREYYTVRTALSKKQLENESNNTMSSKKPKDGGYVVSGSWDNNSNESTKYKGKKFSTSTTKLTNIDKERYIRDAEYKKEVLSRLKDSNTKSTNTDTEQYYSAQGQEVVFTATKPNKTTKAATPATKQSTKLTNNNKTNNKHHSLLTHNVPTSPININTPNATLDTDNMSNRIRNTVTDVVNNASKSTNSNKTNNILSKVGDFVKENPENVIAGGANLIGSTLSWILNKNRLNNMQPPKMPVPKMAAKLKTNINIEPQLDKMRESINQYAHELNRNSTSSANTLNRLNNYRFNTLMQGNQLYGIKENAETQLINNDRMNRQSVANTNIDAYNQHRNAVTQFNNNINDMKGENDQAFIAGVNNAIQDVISRRERDNALYTNADIMRIAYPHGYDYTKGKATPTTRKRVFNS